MLLSSLFLRPVKSLIWLWGLIVLAGPAGLWAQKPFAPLQFTHLGVKEGLSQSTVLAVQQDSLGFIWIGTRDGLNRYDGYQFEPFREQPGDSNSLPANHILAIAPGPGQQLWIGTSQGLARYDGRRGRIERCGAPPGLADQEIRCLLPLPGGQVWTGTKDGLFLYDPQQRCFSQPDSFPLCQAVGTRYVTALARSGPYWWLGTTEGLYLYRPGTPLRHFLPRQPAPFTLTDDRIEALLPRPDGQVWVGTYGGGVNLLDPERGWQQVLDSHSPDSRRLSNDFVRSLAADPAGRLWIGTFEGLNIYDPTAGQMQRITYDARAPRGLSHGSIRALFCDRKGAVWAGTYFGGISYYDPDQQRFAHYTHQVGDPYSLSYDVIGAMAEDTAGTLWIGSERGGVDRFDPATGRFGAVSGMEGQTIKSLLAEGDRLWCGAFRQGLWLRPSPQAAWRQVAPAVGAQTINDLARGPEGTLWLATDRAGGIHAFDPQTNRLVDFPLRDSLQRLLEHTDVKALHFDPLGYLWLATRGKGLIAFHPQQPVYQHFRSQPGDTNSLALDVLNHVGQTPDGSLWVATQGGGLCQLDRARGRFRTFTTAHGLPNNNVLGTLSGGDSLLWVSTLSGIARFDRRTETFQAYDFRSGLPLEELNEGAFFQSRSGILYFGGSNGLMAFDPANIRPSPYAPPALISGLRLFNQRVQPGDSSGLLAQVMPLNPQLSLTYEQAIFTLQFSALNFYQPQNNRYAYRLLGLEKDWNVVQDRRSATYTRLKEGEYVFEVKAANSDGVWQAEPTRLAIHIATPWWRSWWAMLLYGGLVLGAVLVVRTVAVRSAQLRNDLRIQQLEAEKREELHQAKLQFFTDVSHEFRTPLTLILTPLEQLVESGEGTPWLKAQLQTMRQNGRRLMMMINQLLEMRALELGKDELQAVPVQPLRLVEVIVGAFEAWADRDGLELRLEREGIGEEWFLLDQGKWEKILYNLLSNALKFTPAGGAVTVKLSGRENELRLAVSDTGPGMSKAEQGRVFERFYKGKTPRSGSGIGLALTRSLVERLGGRIDLYSQPGAGSTFQVTLPKQLTAAPAQPQPGPEVLRRGVFVFEAPAALPAKPDPAPARSQEMVLVVEDQADLRAYLQRELSAHYQVVALETAEAALKAARKTEPTLLLSDVMLPGKNGIELCTAFRQDPRLSHIPVILLTARQSDADRLQGLEAGADDYLGKPFILRELLARIHNQLQARQRLREHYQQDLSLSPGEVKLQGHDEALLGRVMAAIEAHIDDPTLSVEALSQEVGLSRVHLYRKLKALTGFSPSELLREVRLKRAAQLLVQQKVSVSEVAYLAGFQDLTYFGKAFKKRFGMSPSAYVEAKAL